MTCVFLFIQETFLVPILYHVLHETVWDVKANETPKHQQTKCTTTVKTDIKLTHHHHVPIVTVTVGGDRQKPIILLTF